MEQLFKNFLKEVRSEFTAQGHNFLLDIFEKEFLPWCKKKGYKIKVVQSERLSEEDAICQLCYKHIDQCICKF